MAALCHLLEKIGLNLTNGKEQRQSKFENGHFMHFIPSWLDDRVVRSHSPSIFHLKI